MNTGFLSFISLITSSFLLLSCHFIDKQSALKAEMSKRKITAVQPSKISVLNPPVSAMVFFQDHQPVCMLSALEHRHLVPLPLRTARQNKVSLSLSKCHQREVSVIQDIERRSVFLNKDGGYQTAGAQFIGVAAICLASGAIGAYLALEESKRAKEAEDILDTGLSVTGLASSLVLLSEATNKLVKGAGLAGVCSFSSSAVVFLYNWIDKM